MGSITSRQNAAVEEADISANHAYKYPPRAGKTKRIVKSICFRQMIWSHFSLDVYQRPINCVCLHHYLLLIRL